MEKKKAIAARALASENKKIVKNDYYTKKHILWRKKKAPAARALASEMKKIVKN